MKLGLLFLAMGGPDSLESVEPYLKDVRRGRPFTPEFLEDLKDKYRQIGGKSPLLDISRAQAQAVEARLRALGLPSKAYVGMRHWHPYIRETFQEMAKDGVERVIAICLAPQFSALSIGAYREQVEAARRELAPGMDVAFIEGWHAEPSFLDAIAGNVREALDRFPAGARPHLLLTAHSLPQRILKEGDPYVAQLEETARGVMERLPGVPATRVFQSKSPTGEPWLGPDAAEVLPELARRGVKDVVMAPIGFISDHLEILYDIDILYRGQAKELGMRLERMPSLNVHPLLIQVLADRARAALGLPLLN